MNRHQAKMLSTILVILVLMVSSPGVKTSFAYSGAFPTDNSLPMALSSEITTTIVSRWIQAGCKGTILLFTLPSLQMGATWHSNLLRATWSVGIPIT